MTEQDLRNIEAVRAFYTSGSFYAQMARRARQGAAQLRFAPSGAPAIPAACAAKVCPWYQRSITRSAVWPRTRGRRRGARQT